MQEARPPARPAARQVRAGSRRGNGPLPPARRYAPSTTRSSGSHSPSRCGTRSSTDRGTSETRRLSGCRDALLRWQARRESGLRTGPSHRGLSRPHPPNSEREAAFEVWTALAGRFAPRKSSTPGEHPTLRLRTREGYELTGTRNHPVLCLVDMVGVPILLWKLLEEIEPGDRVLVARAAQASDELGRRAREGTRRAAGGAFLAEGFISGRGARGSTTSTPRISRKFSEAYDAVVGGQRQVYERIIASGSRLWELDIQKLDTSPLGARLPRSPALRAEKRVPERVWCGNSFLQARLSPGALWRVTVRHPLLPRKTIQISYSTYSEQLARDVQLLLLEFWTSRGCAATRRERFKGRRHQPPRCEVVCPQCWFSRRKQGQLERHLAVIPSESRAPPREITSRSSPTTSAMSRLCLLLAETGTTSIASSGGIAAVRRSSTASRSAEVRQVTRPLVGGELLLRRRSSPLQRQACSPSTRCGSTRRITRS